MTGDCRTQVKSHFCHRAEAVRSVPQNPPIPAIRSPLGNAVLGGTLSRETPGRGQVQMEAKGKGRCYVCVLCCVVLCLGLKGGSAGVECCYDHQPRPLGSRGERAVNSKAAVTATYY